MLDRMADTFALCKNILFPRNSISKSSVNFFSFFRDCWEVLKLLAILRKRRAYSEEGRYPISDANGLTFADDDGGHLSPTDTGRRGDQKFVRSPCLVAVC